MLWPLPTAGPVPAVRTSVVSLAGADVFGTVSVGFSPKLPVTPTPTLVLALPDEDPDDDDEDPPQAARASGASRLAATSAAPWRADSFTGSRRGEGTDSHTVTAAGVDTVPVTAGRIRRWACASTSTPSSPSPSAAGASGTTTPCCRC